MHKLTTPSLRLTTWCFALALGAFAAGCGGGGGSAAPAVEAPGTVQQVDGFRVVTVAAGLSRPWGLTFLPSGELLFTERSGTMRTVMPDGSQLSAPITGLPSMVVAGQGGLLDVALDPDHANNQRVYWSYSEADAGTPSLSGTAVARGELVNGAMTKVQVIYRQAPKLAGSGHFGGRLAFGVDGNLFVTLGERQQDDPANPTDLYAQNIVNGLGKVVRIDTDGQPVSDNPTFANGATAGLYSIGHRNPQAAAVHPVSGELWLAEHGPQGGDEVNRVTPGANYGWPKVSYGCAYGAPPDTTCKVNGGTHAPTYTEPLTFWTPTAIAPSGMVFYTGTRYAGWQDNLFVGALAGQAIWRLTIANGAVTNREALLAGRLGRIRDVRQGPDGWLYVLTDEANGRILRLER